MTGISLMLDPTSTMINLIYFVLDYFLSSSILITVCRVSRLYTALGRSQRAVWLTYFNQLQDLQAPCREVGRERKFKAPVPSILYQSGLSSRSRHFYHAT
jgi:hypothetical protein